MSYGSSQRPRDPRPLLFGACFTSLVLLPFALGPLCAPPGKVFAGTLKALGDENEYLSAIHQGGLGNWLWHNPFMVHPPVPMVMYLPYLAFGHFGALLGLSTHVTYALMHGATALALFAALWVLGSLYFPPRSRGWFVAFALGTSGLYWLDALLDMAGHAPASLVWMAMPPLSGLTSALMGAHETLGTAGQVMVLTALLAQGRVREERRWAVILYGCLGTLLIGLTLPMLLPIPLAVAGLMLLMWVSGGAGVAERLRIARRAAPGMCLILLPGLLAAAYYFWQLRYGPWSASILRMTSQRPVAESLLQWGVTLPLGLWGWRRAPVAVRPLANALALWCCCALVGLLLPFWQGFRFSTGITTMVGALFSLGVLGTVRSGRWRMRILLLASLGALVHLIFVLSVLLAGGARSLYGSEQRDQAMQWFVQHTGERDVVLAPIGFSNNLVGVASCRVVAGHGFMTFDMPLREHQLRLFYGADASVAGRLTVLHATTADYVVYDRQDAEDGPFDPRGLPGLRPAFSNDQVTVFSVRGAR